MTVSGLDARAVKNEKDQQESEPPLECGVTVLKRANRHAGQSQLC